MLLHDAPWVLPGIGRGRRAVTATDTVTAADQGLTIDATSGTFTENLTASATLGAGFHVAIYNSGSGVITIDPAGAETIRTPAGTATTLALTQGQGVVLSCTGAAWEVIASVGLAAASSTALTVQDSVFTIIGNVDATKTLVTQVDTQGAGFTLTLDVGAQTGSRTILVPVLVGTDTLMSLGTAQSISGVKTFTANIIQTGATTFSTGTGAISLNGAATFASDLFYSTVGTLIAATTSDGTDTSLLRLCGGGAAATTRGAAIDVAGNEHTSLAGQLRLFAGDTGVIRMTGGTGVFVTNGKPFVVTNSTSATPAFDADFTNAFGTGCLTQVGSNNTSYSYVALHNAGSSVGAYYIGANTRSVGGTDANTIVQNGDALMAMAAFGADGAAFREAGRMQFIVDGAPGASDMPGRWELLVTPDGSTTPAKAITVSSTRFANFTSQVTTGLSWTPANSSLTSVTVALAAGGLAANEHGVIAAEGNGTSGTNSFGVLSLRGKRSVPGDYATANSTGDTLGQIGFEGVSTTTGVLRWGAYIKSVVSSVQSTSISSRLDFVVVDSSGADVTGLSIATTGVVTVSGITVASAQALTLGNTAVAATPVATHTVTIKDAAGTTYRLLCVV